MKIELPRVETFTVPGVELSFVDIRNLSRPQRRASVRTYREVLQVELLGVVRPGVFLCLPTPATTVLDGCDPSLPTILLGVYNARRENVGALSLYNIRLERNAGDGLRLSAMPAPGFRPFTSWRRVLRHLLEEDFSFEGGRPVDVAQWDFPETRGHRWKEDVLAVSILDELGGHDREDRPDGSPTRVRRRGAPSRG